MDKFRFSKTQLLIIALVIVAAFLLLDYQSRKSLLYQVQTQRDILREEVTQLRQTEQALVDKVEYASSYAIIEQFAREDMHAGQAGDILVVPIPAGEFTPTPVPVVIVTSQPVNNLDVWLAIFFES